MEAPYVRWRGVGFAVSLPLGSLISDYYGWRMTYHTAIPFIVALAILTIWKVRESKYRRPDVKVDYVGAAALGIPLALIVLAMSEGSSWGWHSVLFLTMLTVGIVLLIPMFIYESHYYSKGGEAIFDMKLLSKKKCADCQYNSHSVRAWNVSLNAGTFL